MSSRRDFEAGPLRPLADVEQRLLTAMLNAEFPGSAALKKQAAGADARLIDSEGSLALRPAPDAPAAEVVRRIPVEAELEDSDGVTIHVLLHVLNGFLDELEIYRDDSGPLQRALAPEELRLIIL